MIKTKAQKDLLLAEKCVSEVEDKDKEVQKIYGGLCHNFPVMVMTCGLCQAVAFSLSKAGENKKEREQAHTLLLNHLAELITETDTDPKALLGVISKAGTMEYLTYTRQVLSAWIYFKRFAVSILEVNDASAANDKGERD